ncbi:MAG TPA: hypothetical protein VGQ77_16340 [Methylomirabilota bacterium]|nr:hypothetical protein [Methylomirabilota bacterium]
MKNRTQSFDCSIAAKTVWISLRHGGGLQEPASVYVRCEERDCQYVDLNQAPCPLRIDMFADGSDRRVADHLTTCAGARHCYACLTELLGVTHDQVRRASWRLKDAEGFSIRPSRCVRCQRRRVTIALGRTAAQSGPLAGTAAAAPLDLSTPSALEMEDKDVVDAAVNALEKHLRGSSGYALCAHCLARDLKVSAAAVRDAMWRLEAHEAFQIHTAQCVSCLLWKRVIRYEDHAKQLAPAGRVIKFLVDSPGLTYCPSCVAFATDLGLGEATRLLTYLESVQQFQRRAFPCVACGRGQSSFGFIGGDIADAARPSEVPDVRSGDTRYRGFRIDLLSFQAAQKWRPFALIKAPAGTLAPKAPPIVMDLTATQIEADELAASRAREWIDGRFP